MARFLRPLPEGSHERFEHVALGLSFEAPVLTDRDVRSGLVHQVHSPLRRDDLVVEVIEATEVARNRRAIADVDLEEVARDCRACQLLG